MIIKVPKDIEEEFLNLLDIAQASIDEYTEEKCSKLEKKTLKFIRKLLGNGASKQWKNQREKYEGINNEN